MVDANERDACGGRPLLALLLNEPSETSGSRTRSAVRAAGEVLGSSEIIIVNLCPIPTKSVVELNAHRAVPWEASRSVISSYLATRPELLAGWGVAGLTGGVKASLREQLRWLIEASPEDGARAWTVGGSARHPSRWHQYVADKHGRTSGGSFRARLDEVLVRRELRELAQEC